jgi:hypothetical protein
VGRGRREVGGRKKEKQKKMREGGWGMREKGRK